MSSVFSLLIIDPRLRVWRYRLALWLYVIVLIMGAIPGARAEIGHYASGLVLHSFAYAGLTFLLFTGSAGSAGTRALRSMLTAAAMGALDELIQLLLPYRSGSLGDWIVDCSAALLSATLLWLIFRRQPRTR